MEDDALDMCVRAAYCVLCMSVFVDRKPFVLRLLFIFSHGTFLNCVYVYVCMCVCMCEGTRDARTCNAHMGGVLAGRCYATFSP